MKKYVDNLDIVQGVNFEFVNSLRIHGTKFPLNFDYWWAEVFHSKEFVDIVNAGRHREFSTIYIKHN